MELNGAQMSEPLLNIVSTHEYIAVVCISSPSKIREFSRPLKHCIGNNRARIVPLLHLNKEINSGMYHRFADLLDVLQPYQKTLQIEYHGLPSSF